MPHIIIEGPLVTEDIWLAFEPTEFREKGIHFKAEEAFLSVDKKSVLIKSLVVERGYPKNFFVRISQKEPGALTIGLDKIARPEITAAVHRLIGLFAWKILQIEVDAKVKSTNIPTAMGDYEPQ